MFDFCFLRPIWSRLTSTAAHSKIKFFSLHSDFLSKHTVYVWTHYILKTYLELVCSMELRHSYWKLFKHCPLKFSQWNHLSVSYCGTVETLFCFEETDDAQPSGECSYQWPCFVRFRQSKASGLLSKTSQISWEKKREKSQGATHILHSPKKTVFLFSNYSTKQYLSQMELLWKTCTLVLAITAMISNSEVKLHHPKTTDLPLPHRCFF